METPNAFQTVILERVMTTDELNDLTKLYDSGRHHRGGHRFNPERMHIKSYNFWLDDPTVISQVAAEWGVTTQTVMNRFSIIGRLALRGDINIKNFKK